MTHEQIAYYCFLYGCAALAVVPAATVILGAYVRRGEPPASKYDTRRQVEKILFRLAVVSAVVLTPLGANAFWHVSKLTPRQFVIEFTSTISHQRTP